MPAISTQPKHPFEAYPVADAADGKILEGVNVSLRWPQASLTKLMLDAMLAGYIVERVSGQPYDQYIQEYILDPLGMAHSTAQPQTPLDLRPLASVGYTYGDGAFQISPEWIAQPALVPSGAHRASVTDMARFMIAHLQNGRFSDATIPEVRILKETTAQQMHTTQSISDPHLSGMTYGFFDFSDNDQKTIGHVDYAAPMNSLLLLLRDQNLGVFVVYNSAPGAVQRGLHRFTSTLGPDDLRWHRWKRYPLTILHYRKILTVTGIANPTRLYQTIHEWEGQIVHTLEFPDHHPYSTKDWQEISTDGAVDRADRDNRERYS